MRRNIKTRTLSLVIAVLLTVSVLPGFAAAADAAADSVIYNLGSQEVTVDSDSAAEQTATHKLFSEDGSCTIQLEDNAFFPYEVQFKANGVTTVEVFDAPDSTVTVGGHVFSVATNVTDENTLSKIGFTIGGTYIPAVPTPKAFTPGPGFTTYSLLPLKTVPATVSLNGYLPAELKSVKLSAVLSGLTPAPDPTIPSNDKVVWVKKSSSSSSDDDFKVAEQDTVIDLSPDYDYNTSVYLELIVGSAKQLDINNTRYNVTISIPQAGDALSFDLYTQDGSERTEAGARDAYYNAESSSYNSETQTYETVPMYRISVDSRHTADTEFYLGMSLNDTFSGIDAKVYKGRYATAEAAAAGEDVTSSVWDQDMTAVDTGLLGTYADYRQRQSFTVVYSRENTVTAVENFVLSVYPRSNSVNIQGLYIDENDIRWNAWQTPHLNYSNDIEIRTFTLYSEYPENAEYYLRANYLHESAYDSNTVDTYVDMAVVGHFDTLEAAQAANAADIKAQLLSYNNTLGSGYLANYSGSGQNFTVFAEDEVYKFTVKAVNGTVSGKPVTPPSSTPTPGQDTPPSSPPTLGWDTNFYVNGASGLRTYIVPYNDDTYYNNGYQTLLVLGDETNMTELKPTFSVNSTANTKAYAGLDGAEEQESGVSVQDFSNGPVLYTARAEDGRAIKNYNVSFVKTATASSLFVNGPDTREVYINDAYENRHDIFIANVGETELTGLSVALNATNVKLDEYWTVGGEGNDTLADFTKTSNPDNIAKIRLLAAEPGDTNYSADGIISGTITISSTNGGERTVTLTGIAGNPKIVTESVADGVKFVPYSRMIQTNNMHDWNTVTFSLVPGSELPDGLTLLPNGEIYGAPKETGTFEFAVEADYSHSAFTDSIAEYTLTINENTNENVDAQTDAGYEIEVRVPDSINSNTDYNFQIAGEFSEFMKFFLDGNELTRGTDYIAEEGSTKITIRSQTFQDAGNGTHTIAGEFRLDGDASKEMKKAAQNYTLNISTGVYTPPSSPSAPAVNTNVPATVSGDTASATISAQLLGDAGTAGRSITVTNSLGDIVIDEAAVKALGSASGVTVSYTAVKSETGDIDISVNLSRNGTAITEYGTGIITLSIPYTLPTGARSTQIVPYFDNNGELELVMGGHNAATNRVEIQLRHLSDYVVKVNSVEYEVSEGWYDGSLDWAVSRGLLDKFIVDGKVNAAGAASRADFVTSLIKALGIQPLTTFTVEQFSDVSGENADYIRTARQLGIVNGIGGNRFSPDSAAKRGEQFQIVYNLIQAKLSTVNSANSVKTIADFADAAEVPAWLEPALGELLKLGVVQGDGTNLNVKDSFTIGQICVVLQRMATPKAAS